MIDIHSHILPNIDDGARNIEETIQMVKEAYRLGFTEIIATSHYIEENYAVSKIERQKIINSIQKILNEENIRVNIYNGAEVYITPSIISLLEKNIIPTLNNSKYLLLELPMNSEFIYLDRIIDDLISYGVVPILAHPERYYYVQENPKMLLRLIKNGMLVQANLGSIDGIYGKSAQRTVIKLLKNDMVHFLGSDAHRANDIYTRNFAVGKED